MSSSGHGTAPSFRLVACLSTYREGTLATSAAASVIDHVDEIVIWEGPAGPDRLDDAPLTALGSVATDPSISTYIHHGEWATDAAKRTAMLKWCRQQWHDRPLWILWLDGDELLANGHALRDHVQAITWDDHHRGASIANPHEPPTGGIPLVVVEQADGNVVYDHGRLIRADLVQEIVVSNLIYRLINGTEIRLGRRPVTLEQIPKARAIDAALQAGDRQAAEHISGLVMLTPPLPGEPHLIHRPQLRHPARRHHRLHQQEHAELQRLGLPTGAQP